MNVVIPRPSYNGEDVPGLGMVNSFVDIFSNDILEPVSVYIETKLWALGRMIFTLSEIFILECCRSLWSIQTCKVLPRQSRHCTIENLGATQSSLHITQKTSS